MDLFRCAPLSHSSDTFLVAPHLYASLSNLNLCRQPAQSRHSLTTGATHDTQ
jgi:hypothetical protein